MNKPTVAEMLQTAFLKEHIADAANYAAEKKRLGVMHMAPSFIAECESSLEAAFVVWWWVVTPRHLHLVEQRAVQVADRTYRVDLVVEPTDYDAHLMFRALKGTDRCPRIAIELDGHEFHERTAGQVTHRNRRDRDLADAGWSVWHFSGSEFHRDPASTVRDVYERAAARFADAMVSLDLWTADERDRHAKSGWLF